MLYWKQIKENIMKNWIIALSILILPMVTYFVLEKTNADTTGFEAVAANKPSIIKFSSPMCLDCKRMETVINEIIPAYSEKVSYEKVDAQSNDKRTKDLIKKYNVTLVPTCVFLKKDGTVYKRTEGFVEKPEFENHVKGLING